MMKILIMLIWEKDVYKQLDGVKSGKVENRINLNILFLCVIMK